jgi:hypothetical protein
MRSLRAVDFLPLLLLPDVFPQDDCFTSSFLLLVTKIGCCKAPPVAAFPWSKKQKGEACSAGKLVMDE